MLLFAFYIFSAAVVLGMALSLFHIGLVPRRSSVIAALHGITGAAGLGILLFALKAPAHGFANGVQSFGELAAFIAAATLAVGGIFLFFPKIARHGWPIGAHATLGIAAYVLLSGYVLLG